VPFVGPAGKVLDRALGYAAIRREKIYIDNLVRVRPPHDDFARHDPADIERDKAHLTDLISKHKPKLIISLGNEASEFLLGDLWPLNKQGRPEGITNIRGYLWDSWAGRVLTAVHPAACLPQRDPSKMNEVLLQMDMKKAKREIEAGFPALPNRRVSIVTSEQEFLDA